ncbi:MAG: amidohydrolase [Actinomycetota bacterium]
MLVDERHVERVGSGPPPEADRTVDLPGSTIIPGFIDAHVHLSGTGLRHGGLDLQTAGSRDELLNLVGRERRGAEPLFGQGFDETGWSDPSFPTVAEIDALTGRVVILLRADGHIALTNTSGLERSGVLDLEGVERDSEGSPTGVLRGEANAAIQRWYFASMSDSAIEDAQIRAAAIAVSRGVTAVHEMAMPSSRGFRDVEILLGHARELPVDVIVYVADRDIPRVMDLGLPRIGGDLCLDGSLGARTAALHHSYDDAQGAGKLTHQDDELVEFLHNAHLAGLQVGLHAIGDAAIDQALRAWERVYANLDSRGRRHFRARRHRVEHFEMASSRDVERAAALGLAISIQPAFDAIWGDRGEMYESRVGRERAWGMNPFRLLVERGLEVGAGSDTPVTPLDPMYGIWAIEHHHDPTQRMSREQAVRLFTQGSARLGHFEKKGILEAGSAADFAAYEMDPLEEPDVRSLRPVLTVSRGRDVFAR